MTSLTSRAQNFKKYDDLRKDIFTKEEIAELDSEIALEVSAIHSIQEAISKELVSFMAKEDIGFNELTRRLGTSARQTSRVIKCEANLTIASIAEIASVMGKKPKIIFE